MSSSLLPKPHKWKTTRLRASADDLWKSDDEDKENDDEILQSDNEAIFVQDDDDDDNDDENETEFGQHQGNHRVKNEDEKRNDEMGSEQNLLDKEAANDDNSVEEQQHGPDPILDFEPDYSKANSLPFATLCRRLEILLQHRSRKTNRQSKDALWDVIMPNKLRRYIGRGSFFPLLRLLTPDMDTSRPHTGMKERSIAIAWADALGFQKSSTSYRKLLNFNDPSVAGPTAAGDLSVALYEIMEERFKAVPSKLTLGQVNQLLDDLVSIKTGAQRSSHDWRDSQTQSEMTQTQTMYTQTLYQTQSHYHSQYPSSNNNNNNNNKPPRKDKLRQQWVERLLAKTENPLEHKWIVRVILQSMEFGFGSKTVLARYNPLALDRYRMNNNLKSVCTTLSNPAWWKQYKRQEADRQASEEEGHYMEQTKGEAIIGNTIAPMLAQRSIFANAMANISNIHREYLKKLPRDDPKKKMLPLKHPALCIEVKLDGERIIAHVQRGQVTMQTRRSVWYSGLYSPVLGPGIRRAIGKWDVDVMLDGEVIAWDNVKRETIPFGNNRSVALARRRWMESQGLVESRDLNLHVGQKDLNVMRFGSRDVAGVAAEEAAGSQCFLKYVVFDILYVGGPAATRLLSQALHCPVQEANTGSLIHMSGFARKQILHQLLVPQKHEIELVPAVVIRPSGASVNTEDYFSPTCPLMDDGHLAADLDSIEYAFKGEISDREAIESQLRDGNSDAELSLRRTESVDKFYADIVENQAQEGIILKDLNASYLFDDRKYWFKHKPENEDLSHASDIDLLILGGYFATGLGPSGLLSSFLLGCVDDENPEAFLVVGKINAGGMRREVLDVLLKETGYQKKQKDQDWDSGKWFKETNPARPLPDFISSRSFQHQGEDKGPVLDKTKYPDLWIEPEDSVILTVKAAEIVVTEAFSAGVTLRFARIERVRLKSEGDAKQPHQVESHKGLEQRFRETQQLREGSGSLRYEAGTLVGNAPGARRFQTPEEYLQKKATKRTLNKEYVTWQMPVADKKDSSALEGLEIVALEGTYIFDEQSLDAEEARDQGWWEIAKTVRSRDDVLLFISKHGGQPKISESTNTSFIVGGRPDDAKVVAYHRGLGMAAQKTKSRSKMGLAAEDMKRIGVVRKWTYLYSIVHEWVKAVAKGLKVEEGDGDDMSSPKFDSSILSTHPHFLRPSRHYLLDSESSWNPWDEGNDEVMGISLMKDVGIVDLKRGLEEARFVHHQEGKKRQRREHNIPWQFEAIEELLPSQRWVVAGPLQVLWPFKQDETSRDTVMVMYPDLFANDFGIRSHGDAIAEVKSGNQLRWKQARKKLGSVASSIPLVRAMGAQLVPHLTDKVTHVLCELRHSYHSVGWDEFDAEKFVDPKHARRLRIRISGVKNSGKVQFVSPDWIRGMWGSINQS